MNILILQWFNNLFTNYIMWKNIERSMDFTHLLKNNIVLYLLLLISLVNMYSYVVTNNQLYIAFMLIIGFLTSFFSKNMIVILFLSIAIPNIIHYGSEIRVREGFDTTPETAHVEKLTGSDIKDLTDIKSVDPNVAQSKIDKISNTLNTMQKRIDTALATTEKIKDKDKKDKVKSVLHKQKALMDTLSGVGEKYKEIMTELSQSTPELNSTDFST